MRLTKERQDEEKNELYEYLNSSQLSGYGLIVKDGMTMFAVTARTKDNGGNACVWFITNNEREAQRKAKTLLRYFHLCAYGKRHFPFIVKVERYTLKGETKCS